MLYYIEREKQIFIDFGEFDENVGRIMLMHPNKKERPTGILFARHKNFDTTGYSKHLQEKAQALIGFNNLNDVSAILQPLVAFIKEISTRQQENDVKQKYEKIEKKLIRLVNKMNDISIEFPNSQEMLVKDFKSMVYHKMDNGTHLTVFIPNNEHLNSYIGRLGKDNSQKEPFAFGFENTKKDQASKNLEITFAFHHTDSISLFINVIIMYLNSVMDFVSEQKTIYTEIVNDLQNISDDLVEVNSWLPAYKSLIEIE